MNIAVAKRSDMGPKWKTIQTEFVHPFDIRKHIHSLIQAEESSGIELFIVTMNRTILDMVTCPDIKSPGPISYDDVVVWNDGKLTPLLDMHDENWLSHSALGDLFDRGEILKHVPKQEGHDKYRGFR